MSNIPDTLLYTSSHEWVEVLSDGTARIGITDHAQELLGDMVYVEVPEVGDEVKSGEECAVVESVKAASDVYSPISGVVVAVNENLAENPGLVNGDPYSDGWIMRIKIADEGELEELFDAESYQDVINEDDH
ncbi:MAG: glycine cleavage system protein GcvH [Pseudomonadota bacterium]|nr:glycine cleavage system protein GcvH [Pseudomonadota bacterium]